GRDGLHFDYGRAVLLDPHAALVAGFALPELHVGAIHAHHRVIPLADLSRVTLDIVANQGAAETVGGAVRQAAMHDRTVEEEHVARLHDDRLDRGAFGDGNSDVGEALGRVGLHGAQHRPGVAAPHNLQTAVDLVTRI